MSKHAVLFVCLGNICRSPTAEGVFREKLARADLLDDFTVDSAGTGNWHVGSTPDARAQQAARQRGYDISDLRGRQVEDNDLDRFDYVIAMDQSNQLSLKGLAGEHRAEKVHLMLEFASASDLVDIPDPYYGGLGGFDLVIDLIELASDGLLESIVAES